MKPYFFLSIVFMILMACSHPDVEQQVSIIPHPAQMDIFEGHFEINENTKVYIKDGDTESIAQFLVNKIESTSHFKLQVVKERPDNNMVAFLLEPGAEFGAEGYVLNVSEKGVEIKAASPTGLFYGLQSLLQLLPAEVESQKFVQKMKWTLPFVSIKDEPRFKWRGMHLDVCRHFVPVENIKRHLDMMAILKLNTFHWHLTEDQAWRIEIKKYPLLTQIGSNRIEGEGHEYGGFYSQEEIKDIVKYAADRHITVVPEIELPGHALAALTAYPQYSCTGGPFKVRNVWGVEPDVYCAGKEETFQFLEDIIAEVVTLFPSEYFHIGGDECPKDRWKECKQCQARIKNEKLKDEHELQSYFIKRIEKVLLAHQKKMIGWDEILEGGLAKSAAVMSWRGEQGGIEAASQGHDVVMTPGNWCYLDHFQGDSRVEPVAIGGYTTLKEAYEYEPLPKELKIDKANHVLGTQGNVWTEYMYTPELVEYFVYPRLIALAEVNWSSTEKRCYDDFLRRLDNLHQRMDLLGINYHIPLPEGPVNKMVFINNVHLDFSNTRDLKMVYTVDGSQPTLESNVYKQALIFAQNKTIKIATVLKTGKMSPVRTIEAVKESYVDPVETEISGPGLMEQYVEGDFKKVDELEGIKGWIEEANLMDPVKGKKRDGHEKPSASVFTGFIEIPEDGIYEFSSNLDQFFIANRLLIDNGGEVKRYSRNNSTIALRKGKHPVKLVFLNNIVGGWPQAWNGPAVQFRIWGDKEFTKASSEMYSY